MFLGDADVEIAVWKFIFESLQLGPAWHGGGDGDDFRVLFRELRDRPAEDVGAGRCRCGIGGAVLDLVGAEAVEFPGVVERGLIAAAFLGDDVKDDRLVKRLQVLEGAD